MALMSTRDWDQWIREYAASHRHPANRLCHTVGIPLIALSLPVLVATWFVPPLWKVGTVMFGAGWAFQFIGHAYEGKPPEFFRDWRFLFVGLRWWWRKLRGRA